jgi:uncharacterized protein YyaL (SSP411 family)
MSSVRRANRLADESSPYLLQHAHNPVDWYPWGEEAFQRAKAEDRPIFLSIGYSSCHWCHVMERECFEDEEVASLMNQSFVNIKVDREERPDIDDLYMKVCQMMTGGGGWPLTIIMGPDRRPFYAATFIPKLGRGGSLGLMDLIPTVMKVWQDRRGEIEKVAEQVTASLKGRAEMRPPSPEEKDLARDAYLELVSTYEERFGGFDVSPKFPTPHKLMLLLRYGVRRKDQKALDMALWTLRNMSLGGMYDHVGYGFHRYSTDRRWFVPHFEKMLYDQALLVMAYTEAYQLTKDDWFKKVACDTLRYVQRDLTSSDGGFYSSEDADSEGEEGKFYTFTYGEVVRSLGEDAAGPFLEACDIREAGNYKEEASGRYLGRNILHLTDDIERLAVKLGLSRAELSDILTSGFQALYRLREGRTRPALDDKVLLDWNGLMIAALAKAYRAFGDQAHLVAAMRAVDMIETKMADPFDGLHHSYRGGSSAVKAFLSDLASYSWGLLELYMASQEMRYLKRARQVVEQMCSDFASPQGDFFLALDNEELLVRGKEHYDGAVPAGNSIATYVLAMLSLVTEDERYHQRASAALQASMPHAVRVPSAHAFLGMAADMMRNPGAILVLNDGGDEGLARDMRKAIDTAFLPDSVFIIRGPGAEAGCKELPHLKDKGSEKGKVTVHICEGERCLPPFTTAQSLSDWLAHR